LAGKNLLGKRVNLLYNGSWSFLDYSSNPIFLALWDWKYWNWTVLRNVTYYDFFPALSYKKLPVDPRDKHHIFWIFSVRSLWVFLWHFSHQIFGFPLFRWFLMPFRNCGILCSCMLNLWDDGLLASNYWTIL
jgi:hypothetical protein